ncbi:hypothetical protein SAEN111111_12140 [Saccharibacillus endophyticus]
MEKGTTRRWNFFEEYYMVHASLIRDIILHNIQHFSHKSPGFEPKLQQIQDFGLRKVFLSTI